MTALEAWHQRPAEEANLFNPAFLGSLVYEFVKSFQKARPEGVPLTLFAIGVGHFTASTDTCSSGTDKLTEVL